MSYKKTRGAISVFLVLILVPCIVVTSVFVDLGRTHMSKSMAESSADLALNTLLTNYDGDLNEYYGMIASCQNIEDFYSMSAQFFLRTISSQGMSEDEIYLLSDYYSYVTGDDSIFDFLHTDVKGETTVSEIKGANLANAALIKTQIVEFMKYRAPIEIARDLLSMFMDSSGNTNSDFTELSESAKNEEVIENKQNYYEAEGELLEAAFRSYLAIRKYYNDAKSVGLNNAKLEEYMNRINGYKDVIRQIHVQYVKNLCNTGGLSKYTRATLGLNEYTNEYKKDHKDVYSSKEKDESGEWVYYIKREHYHDLMDDLKKEIKEFKKARDELVEAGKETMNNMYGTGDGQPYAVQWWVKMNKAINAPSGTNYTTKVKDAAKELMKAYAKVLAAGECEPDPNEAPPTPSTKPDSQKTEKEKDHERDVGERAADLLGQVDSIQKKYLTAGKTDNSDSYLKTVYALEKVSTDNINKINPDKLTVKMDGSDISVSAALTKITNDLNNTKVFLDRLIEELNVAINGKGDTKSLDKLKELAKKYNTNYTKWSNSADDQDTQLKKDDWKAIQGGYTDDPSTNDKDESSLNVDRAAKEITEQAVVKLKTRLSNIKSQLKKMSDAIGAIKYGNAKLYEVKTVEDIRKKSGISQNDIPLNNGELNTFANNKFDSLFKPSGDKLVSLDHLNSNDYNPDINPDENNTVQTPYLFVYFHKQWKDASEEKFDEAKKEEEEAQGQKDDYVNNAQEEAANSNVKRVDIKHDYSTKKEFSALGSFLSSFADLIKTLVSGNITAVRDDIYVTTYLVKMFTFATYENEGRYNLLSTEEQKSLSLENASTKYKTVDEQWKSEKLEDTYNKSLTNKMMNNSNNGAYLAELEYILYGKSTCKDNVKAAMGSIYGIRLILNIASAFKNFWGMSNPTGQAINAVANAISAAFCGVIPAAVIKVILLPILAAIESAVDITRLSKGFPVELFKMADDWWVSIPSTANGFAKVMESLLKGGGLHTNEGKGMFYSQYILLYIYLGLSSGGDTEKAMLERTGEVIQTNMRQHKEIDSSYTVKKSRVYFKIESTLRVKPLMITLPFFQMDDYKNNMETKDDWCTYSISTVRGYS